VSNRRTIPGGGEPSLPTFALVLAGGGARGFSHAGVLRALEEEGFRPSAIVGVSMGAVIGVTYALRLDWYDAVLEMDTHTFPQGLPAEKSTRFSRISLGWSYLRFAKDLVFGWGPGMRALQEGRALLEDLTEGRDLQAGRIPVVVSTTDLTSGDRVLMRSGKAADAVYASAALAGILAPLKHEGMLLADGAYTDLAPVDVAREFGCSAVIAVDPGQTLIREEVTNGYQALIRATEICHLQHADLRFRQADLVLRPEFSRIINTLDFGSREESTAAGVRAVRNGLADLHRLLGNPRKGENDENT
jgi:NTE family protein